jgi:hypothetical protein
MVWKNGKTAFHGVELFPKLASMVWKTGESGFHGVEKPGGWKQTTTLQAATGTKVGSMPWNFLKK